MAIRQESIDTKTAESKSKLPEKHTALEIISSISVEVNITPSSPLG